MNYKPDRWLVVKIQKSEETIYKLFGSWGGGYTYGESWRMNSGITSITEDERYYYFHGNSGSCYQCNKEMYGSTSYGWSIIKQMEERVKDITLTVMEEQTNWKEIIK